MRAYHLRGSENPIRINMATTPVFSIGFGCGPAYTIKRLMLFSRKILVTRKHGSRFRVCFSFIFCCSVVQESPRWLITYNNNKRAEEAIRKIFRINRRPLPNMEEAMKRLSQKLNEAGTASYGFGEILRLKQLRKNMVCLFVMW